MKILIKHSGWLNHKYGFHILSLDGEIIATSINFDTLKECEDMAAIIRVGMSRSRIVYNFDRDEN